MPWARASAASRRRETASPAAAAGDRGQHRLAPPPDHLRRAARDQRQRRGVGRRILRQPDQRLLGEDLERGPVGGAREVLAELVELAQDREIRGRQLARALESHERVGIHDPLDGGLGRQRRALLLDPGEPADARELLREPRLESEQMQHVRLRIAALGFGERAARPVVALPRRRQLDAEIGPEQHVQPEGPGPEKARGDRGVEQRGEREPTALELD